MFDQSTLARLLFGISEKAAKKASKKVQAQDPKPYALELCPSERFQALLPSGMQAEKRANPALLLPFGTPENQQQPCWLLNIGSSENSPSQARRLGGFLAQAIQAEASSGALSLDRLPPNLSDRWLEAFLFGYGLECLARLALAQRSLFAKPAALAEPAAFALLLAGEAKTRIKPLIPACLARLEAQLIARQLIHSPSNQLNPKSYSEWLKKLAKSRGLKFSEVVGKAVEKDLPLLHWVGRAAEFGPRLCKLTFGGNQPQTKRKIHDLAPHQPAIVLVGKGVTFDSGGLQVKPHQAMDLMRKDMAGSATALASFLLLIERVQALGLRCPRVELWLPLCENAISSQAMRPGDRVQAASGDWVEIGHTDAEGRLILADCLFLASQPEPGKIAGKKPNQKAGQKPAVIVNLATLTGAMRVALGTDLPGFFASDKALQDALFQAGENQGEPLWPMPLHAAYRKSVVRSGYLHSTGKQPLGGAITAALFLQHFVGSVPFVHIDMMGWNQSGEPGRPAGGDPQILLALEQFLLGYCK